LLCLRNARAFPLLPAALASVPFGFVLVRVRVLKENLRRGKPSSLVGFLGYWWCGVAVLLVTRGGFVSVFLRSGFMITNYATFLKLLVNLCQGLYLYSL